MHNIYYLGLSGERSLAFGQIANICINCKFKATNQAPSSHIAMRQNIQFLIFETKIFKSGNAMQ